jgi:hypothetical protein
MREIIMEIELLYTKMNEVNKEVESEIGNSNMPFSKVLYALTKGISQEDLFMMTDDKLIKLIQKIQIIEG